MGLMEWIFGWDHETALEQARSRCLSRIQTAVDAFHGRMLSICGYKENECGDCWNEIPEGREHLYESCPNYESRCIARKQTKEAYEAIMKDFRRDLDKAYVNSFNFLARPLAWCYVICGGLERSRKRMERIIKTASKCILIPVLAAVFLAGPTMAVDANAKRGYAKIFRSFSRRTAVRAPSVGLGTVIVGGAASAAAGTIIGETVYDAMKPDEEQNSQVPVNEQEQMQQKERPFNAGRGDCGCQGN